MLKIKCPHCHYRTGCDPEELPWDDGDTREISCGDCERIMTVIAIQTTIHDVVEDNA